MQGSELIERLNEAFELRASGDASAALASFESLEMLSEHSRDISALRLFQSYCLMDMGNSGGALERMNGVTRSDLDLPLRGNYEYQFARVLHSLNRSQDAIAHAKSALRIYESLTPDLKSADAISNARIILGTLLAESNRCAEAAVMLRQITEQDQGWVFAKMRLGDCYMEKGKYTEAIECYMAVASGNLKADSAATNDAFRNIGVSYYWLGEHAKAVDYLSRVKDAYLEHPDLNQRILRFLALSNLQIGRVERKKKSWLPF